MNNEESLQAISKMMSMCDILQTNITLIEKELIKLKNKLEKQENQNNSNVEELNADSEGSCNLTGRKRKSPIPMNLIGDKKPEQLINFPLNPFIDVFYDKTTKNSTCAFVNGFKCLRLYYNESEKADLYECARRREDKCKYQVLLRSTEIIKEFCFHSKMFYFIKKIKTTIYKSKNR
jgi:hypothetical protein